MLKTNPLLLETMQCPIIKPRRRFLAPEGGKTQKMTKIFKKLEKKMQKLASFCVFVFVVPKHIAHKIVIENNLSRKKPSSTFKNFNLGLIKQKTKKITKHDQLQHFEPKNS